MQFSSLGVVWAPKSVNVFPSINQAVFVLEEVTDQDHLNTDILNLLFIFFSQIKLISKQMTYGCREVASNHHGVLLFYIWGFCFVFIVNLFVWGFNIKALQTPSFCKVKVLVPIFLNPLIF